MIDKKTVKDSCDAEMDEFQNSLLFFALMTAHMVMQFLAWMCRAIYAVAVGRFLS